MLLADEEWRRSNAWIAEKCRVTDELVASVRSENKVQISGEKIITTSGSGGSNGPTRPSDSPTKPSTTRRPRSLTHPVVEVRCLPRNVTRLPSAAARTVLKRILLHRDDAVIMNRLLGSRHSSLNTRSSGRSVSKDGGSIRLARKALSLFHLRNPSTYDGAQTCRESWRWSSGFQMCPQWIKPRQ